MSRNEKNDGEEWKQPEKDSGDDSSATSCLRHWILDARGEPIECGMMEWATWVGTRAKIVDRTTVGGGFVSTIFLGIDHNYSDEGPPILWETMVFRHNGFGQDFGQWRCSGSREQALAMHKEAVQRVRRYIRFPRPFSRRQKIKLRRQARRRTQRMLAWLRESAV